MPQSGLNNYSYFTRDLEEKQNDCGQRLLQRYNYKKAVATLEAMQKMFQFYQNKGIDMLKLGCTPPNLANISPHKSSNYKFCSFFDSDKDFRWN